MTGASPSGQQYRLAGGGYRATIVEVGGGIRELSFAGRPLVQGYAEDEMCSSGRGQLLIPWPNRIDAGRYRFGGQDLQLAITEPSRNCAIHGLARWANWSEAEPSSTPAVTLQLRPDELPPAAQAVTLQLRLHGQPGWPYVLDLSVDYDLSDAGLAVTVTATNVGVGPAPYGNGAHPYLTVGTERIDPCLLHLPAATHVAMDGRGLPTGVEPVASTAFDFRSPRPVGGRVMDDTFTDLERDSEGRAWVTLTSPDGQAASLWVDASYPWLQVFTGDHLPAPELRRTAMGIEPMSCPANAYVSGDGVVVLEPGERAVGRWGIVAGPQP